MITGERLAELIELNGKGLLIYGKETDLESGSITFEIPNRFDWCNMRANGMHPSCVVLADHYTIESEFAKVLEMLHRFD